jgi:hypothetical protein
VSIKPNVNSKGARSGHPERWDGRAVIKNLAKKARRKQDKRSCKED